jgi:rod shape determining protein RodA
VLRTRFLKNFDWILFGVTVFLVVIGLLIIWSTSFKATRLSGSSDVIRQGIFAVIGIVALVVAARVDYRTWRNLTPWLYGLMIILLLIVAIFSKPILGAQRWIDFGFFQFQPSEFAKLVVTITLARFFSDNYDRLENPKYLLFSLGIIALPVGLVMRQPDLGTALVIMAIWTGMALVSRIRLRYFAGLAALGLAALPFMVSHLQDYQKARLTVFLNPQSDPLGAGHNVIQSTITIGSGQMFGRGLAAGSQSQLNFLPELAQHTDFVFAVLGEKMGFVGGVLLLALFAVLMWRGLRLAHQAQDRFGFFLATGIVSMLLFHVVINVGMNMGIAPVTGIPLPFVSYGGTALMVTLASIGLLESVALRRKKLQFGV